MYSKKGGGKKEPIWREHMGEREKWQAIKNNICNDQHYLKTLSLMVKHTNELIGFCFLVCFPGHLSSIYCLKLDKATD